MVTTTPPTGQLGPFRLLSVLGEGAMGVVYLAEQAEPQREVALKVIRVAAASERDIARFRREAELLAELEHPGIARIYAAGNADTPTGTVPYLAMECVRGVDVLAHADQAQLDTAGRLRLMAELCRTVHFAHSRGVIHRDLKPSNILVDAAGQAKVLDFGVARALGSGGGTEMTLTGQVIGTLQYMSGEQLRGQAGALDPRSDVYALGVIAYQMLSGRLPYPALAETTIVTVSEQRRGEPTALGKVRAELRGDPETIVMKAIAREAEQRYASAADFAADIERCLARQPIAARPPTAGYLLRLFIQRHRALTTGAAVAIVGLLAATAFSVRAALAESAAKGTAEQRLAEQAAVNDFLVRMFTAADPEKAQGVALTVREVLDSARSSIAADATLPAGVAASLSEAIGSTYLALGDAPTALKVLEGGIEAAGSAAPEQLVGMRLTRAQALYESGRAEDAEAEARAVIAALPQDPSIASAERRVSAELRLFEAIYHQGRRDEAAALVTQVLEHSEAQLGPLHRLTLSALTSKAELLQDLGQLSESLSLQTEGLARNERAFGAHHPETLIARNNLGATYYALGDYAKAIELTESVVNDRRRILGSDHPLTLGAINNICAIRLKAGQLEGVEPLIDELVAGAERRYGPQHRYTLIALGRRARLLELRKDLAGAEQTLRGIVAAREHATDVQPRERLSTLSQLARVLVAQAKRSDAAALLEQIVAQAAAQLGEDNTFTAQYRADYAAVLVDTGDFTRARAELARALPILTAEFGGEHPRVTAATELLKRADGTGTGPAAGGR